MASISKRGKKWIVRWRDPDGLERIRTCPDKATAEDLRREVERAGALGRRWEPDHASPVPGLIETAVNEAGEVIVTGGALARFLEIADATFAPGTVRHYNRALLRYVQHLATLYPGRRRLTVDLVTKDSIESWYARLRSEPSERPGRPRIAPPKKSRRASAPESPRRPLGLATARLYVGAVHQAWEWMHDSDEFGEHVGRVKRVRLKSPATRRARAPTWEQMDAVIHACETLAREAEHRGDRDTEAISGHEERAAAAWRWRRRLLIVLRFTGLRVEQAMRLQWEDVDLDAAELEIRPELGKSDREKEGRLVPLSPHLVAELAGWGVREGWLIAPWKVQRTAHTWETAEAWEKSGVDERIWKGREEGSKGQPHHAFRKGFKTGLSALKVSREVRDFLLGHHRGIDDHYLDSIDEAREAVALIPPLTPPGKVAKFRRKADGS